MGNVRFVPKIWLSLAAAALLTGATLLGATSARADEAELTLTYDAVPQGWIRSDSSTNLFQNVDPNGRTYLALSKRGGSYEVGKDCRATVSAGITASYGEVSEADYRALITGLVALGGAKNPPNFGPAKLGEYNAVQGRWAGESPNNFLCESIHRSEGVSYYIPLPDGRAAIVFGGANGPVQGIAEIQTFAREAAAFIETMRFSVKGQAAAELPGCNAALLLPPNLKPGDTLAPDAKVTSADNKPVQGPVQTTWIINGRQANSVQWDGSAATVTLQLSCQGHAQEFNAQVPAYVAIDEGSGGPGGPLPPIILLPGMGIPGVSLGTPPAGLGGVGTVPGPKNLGEALVGILGAPTIAAIGTAISALGRGVTAVATVIPMTPTGPPTNAPPSDKSADKKTDKDKQEGKEKDKQDPPKPLDPAAAKARQTLARMSALAASTNDAALRRLVARAYAEAFRPDGTLDRARWAALNAELKQALTRALRPGDPPPGVIGDAAAATAGAFGEFLTGVKDAAKGLVGGMREAGTSVGGALLHPIDTVKSWDTSARQWVKTNLTEEGRAFRDALKEGRTLDALKSVMTAVGRTGKLAVGGAWEKIKEALPVEEWEALTDKNASLEEKLWAVPSAATKLASLLTMFEGAATTKVPGLGADTTLITSARTASAKTLEVAEAAAVKAAESGAGRTAVREAEALARSARATSGMESLVEQGGNGVRTRSFKEAQRILEGNPEMQRAADEALRANQGGKSLYDLRRSGVMSEETHTLLTGRKLQLQEQAMNNAAKRIIGEDVSARVAAGEQVPGRYHTFNATQGNRTFAGGSNVNADLDQTFIGLRKAANPQEAEAMRRRMEQIVQEECNKLGFDRRTLDTNVYRGFGDATGAAPNSTVTLEQIGQTTGTSQQFPVRVTKDGRVLVGDGATAQGREAVIAGRMKTAEAGGVPMGKDPDAWIWEGHQGKPVQLTPAQQADALKAQVDGMQHAAATGEMNQMVKYANRGASVGLPVDAETRDLLRRVAGQKDPLRAKELLEAAGIRTPADLQKRLGL